jgi:putative peptidoglycan lipid II flippase
MSEARSSAGRRITWAATQVVALFVLSKALGLARDVVVGATFGTSAEYSAYVAAFTIPDILFTLIAGGALGSAFIPTFAAYFARNDPRGGWRLASGVVNLLLVVLTGAAILAWFVAPLFVPTLLVPGFPPAQQALTISLTRIMLLAPVLFGVSGVVMGILNARQHFLLPALAPSLLNLALIASAWLLAPRLGVRGLALGYVVGAALHLSIQLPGLARVGARYQPILSLRHPGVQRVLGLMAPRVLGLAAVQLNIVVSRNIASRLGEGAVSALDYAWRLMLLPQGIFAQAVATAAFPTFADQAARGEQGQMRRTMTGTLRAVLFLTLPAAVGLLILGRPLVALVFERGAFGNASTNAVAWALAFYAIGLVGHAGFEIAARAFYAMGDTWTPVWVGGVGMGLNILLSLFLPAGLLTLGIPSHAGLAFANSIAVLVEVSLLLALLRPRLGGLEGRALLRSVARSSVAAVAMSGTLVGWRYALAGRNGLLVGGGGIVLGAGVYLAVAALLGAEEIRLARRMVLRRSDR